MQRTMKQQSLNFDQPPEAQIEGLQYVEDYIDDYQHGYLVGRIDSGPWLDDLKRRVQHYGFKYNYKARKVDLSMRLGALPDWLQRFSEKLHEDGYMPEVADQVIVNEYLPGQGISSHVDCEPCFEDTIVSLSLRSGCVMDFTRRSNPKEKIPLWLPPKSLIVLQGEARYKWMHGIAARKQDKWNGEIRKRGRRVSLTFRKVIIQ